MDRDGPFGLSADTFFPGSAFVIYVQFAVLAGGEILALLLIRFRYNCGSASIPDCCSRTLP
jgi:hypothetical protein